MLLTRRAIDAAIEALKRAGILRFPSPSPSLGHAPLRMGRGQLERAR
jgi:hypothetical protein